MTIRNLTTKQECSIVVLNNDNKYVYIDGMNGNTSLVSEDGTAEPGFVYHDYGFIELVSAYPAVREVYTESAAENKVTLYNNIYTDVTGHYIYYNKWIKILKQEVLGEENKTVLTLKEPVSIPVQTRFYSFPKTMITRMNELTVTPVTDMELSLLKFSYKPTYA